MPWSRANLKGRKDAGGRTSLEGYTRGTEPPEGAPPAGASALLAAGALGAGGTQAGPSWPLSACQVSPPHACLESFSTAPC